MSPISQASGDADVTSPKFMRNNLATVTHG